MTDAYKNNILEFLRSCCDYLEAGGYLTKPNLPTFDKSLLSGLHGTKLVYLLKLRDLTNALNKSSGYIPPKSQWTKTGDSFVFSKEVQDRSKQKAQSHERRVYIRNLLKTDYPKAIKDTGGQPRIIMFKDIVDVCNARKPELGKVRPHDIKSAVERGDTGWYVHEKDGKRFLSQDKEISESFGSYSKTHQPIQLLSPQVPQVIKKRERISAAPAVRTSSRDLEYLRDKIKEYRNVHPKATNAEIVDYLNQTVKDLNGNRYNLTESDIEYADRKSFSPDETLEAVYKVATTVFAREGSMSLQDFKKSSASDEKVKNIVTEVTREIKKMEADQNVIINLPKAGVNKKMIEASYQKHNPNAFIGDNTIAKIKELAVKYRNENPYDAMGKLLEHVKTNLPDVKIPNTKLREIIGEDIIKAKKRGQAEPVETRPDGTKKATDKQKYGFITMAKRDVEGDIDQIKTAAPEVIDAYTQKISAGVDKLLEQNKLFIPDKITFKDIQYASKIDGKEADIAKAAQTYKQANPMASRDAILAHVRQAMPGVDILSDTELINLLAKEMVLPSKPASVNVVTETYKRPKEPAKFSKRNIEILKEAAQKYKSEHTLASNREITDYITKNVKNLKGKLFTNVTDEDVSKIFNKKYDRAFKQASPDQKWELIKAATQKALSGYQMETLDNWRKNIAQTEENINRFVNRVEIELDELAGENGVYVKPPLTIQQIERAYEGKVTTRPKRKKATEGEAAPKEGEQAAAAGAAANAAPAKPARKRNYPEDKWDEATREAVKKAATEIRIKNPSDRIGVLITNVISYLKNNKSEDEKKKIDNLGITPNILKRLVPDYASPTENGKKPTGEAPKEGAQATAATTTTEKPARKKNYPEDSWDAATREAVINATRIYRTHNPRNKIGTLIAAVKETLKKDKTPEDQAKIDALEITPNIIKRLAPEYANPREKEGEGGRRRFYPEDDWPEQTKKDVIQAVIAYRNAHKNHKIGVLIKKVIENLKKDKTPEEQAKIDKLNLSPNIIKRLAPEYADPVGKPIDPDTLPTKYKVYDDKQYEAMIKATEDAMRALNKNPSEFYTYLREGGPEAKKYIVDFVNQKLGTDVDFYQIAYANQRWNTTTDARAIELHKFINEYKKLEVRAADRERKRKARAAEKAKKEAEKQEKEKQKEAEKAKKEAEKQEKQKQKEDEKKRKRLFKIYKYAKKYALEEGPNANTVSPTDAATALNLDYKKQFTERVTASEVTEALNTNWTVEENQEIDAFLEKSKQKREEERAAAAEKLKQAQEKIRELESRKTTFTPMTEAQIANATQAGQSIDAVKGMDWLGETISRNTNNRINEKIGAQQKIIEDIYKKFEELKPPQTGGRTRRRTPTFGKTQAFGQTRGAYDPESSPYGPYGQVATKPAPVAKTRFVKVYKK